MVAATPPKQRAIYRPGELQCFCCFCWGWGVFSYIVIVRNPAAKLSQLYKNRITPQNL